MDICGLSLLSYLEKLLPHATPIAIMISATIAICAIRSNRRISKERAATDFLFSTMENERYWRAIKKITVIHHNANIDMRRFAKTSHKDDPDAREIRYVLNYFEHFAIGIKKKIYDDAVIKEHLYSIMDELWRMLDDYIEEARAQSGKEKIFIEVENLSKRWKKKPLK